MNRPGRVLHILKFYRPAFTGEGTFLERCAATMQALAPEVEHDLLVTHTERPEDPGETARCAALARVIYLVDRAPSELERHVRLLAWMAANLHRYDTVHVRTHADWYFLSYALAGLAGRRLLLSATLDDSVPMLVSRYRPLMRPLARRGFRLFDALISISPKLHRETLGGGSEPGRCHLVPCGITVPPPEPGRRERMRARIGASGPGDLVVLFVGGICDRKDPLALVEAMPALLRASAGARLVLVGPEIEPDYADALRARAAELGVAERVLLAGEQVDPHPWFEAADLFAFASRLEGFGTVVPEAMAHGLPVVARHLPGVNDDFVIQGQTGFLFTDAAGLEAGLLRLAGDAALRARFGAAGRHLAQSRYGMEVIARRWLELYGFGDRIRAVPPSAPVLHLGITASIPDRRFHTPLAPGAAGARPVLLTTVEAGEAFEGPARSHRGLGPVGAMRAQHLAHRVFERHGVVPTYLADHAVATRREGAEPLREMLESGSAELGARLRPWVTPPFGEGEAAGAPRLSPSLELAKAERLARALEDAFGERPRIWRCNGHAGAGPRTADILKRLGCLVYTDGSLAEAAPRGASTSLGPHWIDREQTLLGLPVSAAACGPGGGWARLTPEGTELETAKRLTRALLAAGQRVFVLTYHSTALEPGRTPHIRTAEQAAGLLEWLDAYFAFFHGEVGGRSGSWRELHPALRDEPPDGRAIKAPAPAA